MCNNVVACIEPEKDKTIPCLELFPKGSSRIMIFALDPIGIPFLGSNVGFIAAKILLSTLLHAGVQLRQSQMTQSTYVPLIRPGGSKIALTKLILLLS